MTNGEELTVGHVREVCQPGTDRACAFLMLGPMGWCCGKLDPIIYHQVQLRLAEGSMNATGDNCEGRLT